MASRFQIRVDDSKACRSPGKTVQPSQSLWVVARSKPDVDLQTLAEVAHLPLLKAASSERLKQ